MFRGEKSRTVWAVDHHLFNLFVNTLPVYFLLLLLFFFYLNDRLTLHTALNKLMLFCYFSITQSNWNIHLMRNWNGLEKMLLHWTRWMQMECNLWYSQLFVWLPVSSKCNQRERSNTLRILKCKLKFSISHYVLNHDIKKNAKILAVFFRMGKSLKRHSFVWY